MSRSAALLAWAGFLAVLRIVVPLVPVDAGHTPPNQDWASSVGQARQVCTSPAGRLGQEFSAQAARDCAIVGDVYLLLYLISAAALVCMVMAVVALRRDSGSGRAV